MRMAKGVGQAQVSLADVLVVVAQVIGVPLVVESVEVSQLTRCGHLNIYIIRSSAQHPVTVLGYYL